MTIYQLPKFWQEKIRSLKAENESLRNRLNSGWTAEFKDLPPNWHKTVLQLRKDVARYRTERNQLRDELAAVRAELKARSK
jgi:hypothetical protein